jgi:hypothetical protein
MKSGFKEVVEKDTQELPAPAKKVVMRYVLSLKSKPDI